MGLGKWIGGFLGWMVGGPLGALAGYFIGSLFEDSSFSIESDGGGYQTGEYTREQTYQGQRNSFFFSMMVLASYIIRADGRVMHSEMEFVRNFLRVNFGESAVTQGEQILLKMFEQQKQMNALEDARKQGLISQEDYESRKWQIVQNYHNKIVELIKGQGSEWATMVTTLVESWKAGFENLGSTLPEKLKSIADMAAAAFAVMNAGVKSYTDYANASRDLEVAKVEKTYEDEIKAAGNNEKKRKRLPSRPA